MRSRAFVALVCAAGARSAEGQGRELCIFDNTPQTSQLAIKLPSGQYNNFFGKGIRVRCPGKQVTFHSDSLESYGDEQRIYLVGNVRYDEPRLSLTSDFLTYYQRDERLIATGRVNAKLPNGSTLKGPMAEYHRVIPNIRPAPRLHSTGRPTITIVQKDSLGQPALPVMVEANTVTMVGDSLVYSAGRVVVTRDDVIARGDSVHLDSEREYTVLLRSPSIEGRRGRPFTLFGDRIELTGRNRKLDRVISTSRARAVSEDMTLTSDTIDLRIVADLLQRAIAWGPSRARAASTTQQIVSDSIDVSMPNQRLREMHAVRKAMAQGRPDTTRFRADTVDWLRGDTIIARFDTSATRDTTRSVQLRELVAIGSARSYHHMAAADSTIRIPAINYVVGREITVAFRNQQVARVTVRERASGAYLEPKTVAAKADSTKPPSPRPTTTPIPAPAARPTARPPR